MSEVKDGVLEYQAQSPDEEALTSAARNFGFVFKVNVYLAKRFLNSKEHFSSTQIV